MDFKTRTLGDICDEGGGIIKTGPFGTQLHQSDYKNEGVPVIMPKNIKQGKVSVDDIARIGNQDVSRLSNHRLKKGDIIYGRRGDIGRRALIGDRENGWLCGTGCLRLNLGNLVLDPVFLYYYLGQSQVISWIYNQAIGATMPNLNTDIIRSIPISYPPFPTQRKIAAILSAYDDLIENNTRRIKILEEMAQVLYHEWFVKFRFPGHETVKMVESDLGMIPERWKIVNLSEIVDFIRGVEPGSKNYINYPETGTVPFIRVGDLGNRESNIYIPEELSKNKLLNKTDIVISMDGTVGIVRMGLQGSYSTGIRKTVIRDTEKLSWTYLYLFLRSEYLQGIIQAHAKGTTILHASSALDCMVFALPPSDLIKIFEMNTFPLLKSTLNLTDRIEKLRRTRDLLLPKLMSGEVDVDNLDIETVGIET